MHRLIEEMIRARPVITDGAWGTQLQNLGLATGECPDSWNLTHPDRVKDVARRYVEAGSDVILTNTFRSNRIALAGYGLAGSAAALSRTGVELSRAAAGSGVKVFASMGPTGTMLMTGEVGKEEISSAFEEQARAFAAGGADAVVVETMSDMEEARLALAAAQATGLPVVVSMVFDSGKEKDRTMMGTTVEQVARELTEAGADVVGANCGLGIEGYIPIGKRLRMATDRPIWIKPNAGLPELVDGAIRYMTGPDAFAAHARLLREAGVHFIGGCCGTTPEFIRVLKSALSRET
jgi:5-methyltetrahydrofolate--homocysteine methyltransferase